MVRMRMINVILIAVSVSALSGLSVPAMAQTTETGTLKQSGPRAETTALQARIKALTDRARSVMEKVDARGASGTDVLRSRDRLSAAMQVAAGAPAIKDAFDLRAIREELEQALLELDRVSGLGPLEGRREPPEPLLRAATACFHGSYQEALDIIEGSALVDGDDRESRAYAHLLSAASEFALYRLSGERLPALLSAAKKDVRETISLRPALVPSEKHFSPEFVKFFKEDAVE